MIQNQHITYFIYARKSTDREDKQIASINDQIRECTKIAEQKGLHVLEIISESKSAKAPGRFAFNEMLRRIEKGEATGIISWKPNRLSRNPVDSGRISWLLQHNIIKHIQCYSEDYKPTDNVLMLQIALGMANQYIKDLGSDVKRGMRNKAKNGWYPISVLPIGYIRNPNKQSGDYIIPDPQTFSIVKKLWKYRLTGKYSIADIKREAETLGLVNRYNKPYALNTFHNLFKNEFYAGYFWWKNEHDEQIRHKGKHKSMISAFDFRNAQILSQEKGKPTRINSFSFPFRGHLFCGECQSSITAERKSQVICSECKNKFSCITKTTCPKCDTAIKKMKNPVHIEKVYYHCTKKKKKACSQSYIESSEMHRIVQKQLQDIAIDDDFLKEATRAIEAFKQEDDKDSKEIITKLLKRKTELSTKAQNLIELRLSGEINSEEMKQLKSTIQKDIKDVEYKIQEVKESLFFWDSRLYKALDFRTSCLNIIENGSDIQKKELLLGLGSNLRILDKSLYFTRDFTSEVLDEWYRLYTLKMEGFEPKKSLILQGSFSDFAQVSARLLACLKFVRT